MPRKSAANVTDASNTNNTGNATENQAPPAGDDLARALERHFAGSGVGAGADAGKVNWGKIAQIVIQVLTQVLPLIAKTPAA